MFEYLKYKISTLFGVAVIMAVAIFAFGGVFIYQYYLNSRIPITNVQSIPSVKNSNAQSRDRKTYKNDALGFSLQYPSNIKVQPASNFRSTVGFGNGLYDNGLKYFEVRTFHSEKGAENFRHSDSDELSRDFTLDGVSGFKIISKSGSQDDPEPIRVPFVKVGARRGTVTYVIIFYRDNNITLDDQKIASSFKFIQPHVSSINEWPVYEDKYYYGFTVHYPLEWGDPNKSIGGKASDAIEITFMSYDSIPAVTIGQGFSCVEREYETIEDAVNTTLHYMKNLDYPNCFDPKEVSDLRVENIIIDGKKSVEISYLYGSYLNSEVFVPYMDSMGKNSIIEISYSEDILSIDEFHQFLSTLKFTK